MVELLQTIIPYKVFFAHIVFVVLLFAIFFRRSWGRGVVRVLGRYAILLGFLISLGAIVGSLFYSEIVGFEACVLCWWQRVLLYPTAILFGIALWKKDRGVFKYVVPLVILAAIIGSYQAYANMGWGSILPCTAAEGACSKIYVKAFGYITIPMMSLTVSLYLLLMSWVNRIYLRENSNA
jgi:disulfide bond formation protein DsbB